MCAHLTSAGGTWRHRCTYNEHRIKAVGGNRLSSDWGCRIVWERFSGVFAYLAPNQDGDSGAPVVDRVTGEVLGLHFAGRPDLNKGWIIPGSTIARRLGVRVAAV